MLNETNTAAGTNESTVTAEEEQAIKDEIAVEYIPGNKTVFSAAMMVLAHEQENVAPLKAELEAQIDELKRQHLEKHAERYNLLTKAEARAAEAEQTLRDSVISYYRLTGKKTYDENLGVRVSSKFNYDNDAAVQWAEKNAPVMILRTIDRKSFESLPSTASLDFVSKDETVSAVIKGLK